MDPLLERLELLLALDGESLLDEPFARRRERLEKLVRKPLDLTPWTREAAPWLQGAGA